MKSELRGERPTKPPMGHQGRRRGERAMKYKTTPADALLKEAERLEAQARALRERARLLREAGDRVRDLWTCDPGTNPLRAEWM